MKIEFWVVDDLMDELFEVKIDTKYLSGVISRLDERPVLSADGLTVVSFKYYMNHRVFSSMMKAMAWEN